jgi:uncharacterized protein YdgA (DUF945 family)
MSNKKTVLAAGVALVVLGYAGATWYTGQRAQSGYQEGVVELRKLLGDQAVVADEYQKGFFSSQARLVLQWTPPAAEADAQAEAPAPAAQPLRLVISSHLRHGPLAGARLAAAVVESRFALEGLDEKSASVLAKASAPTLTSVHHFLGGNDMRLQLPAGEIGDHEVAMRWQDMVLDTSLSGNHQQLKGSMRWPEFSIAGLRGSGAGDDEAEDEVAGVDEDDEAEPAAPVERTTIRFSGLESSFDSRRIEGLWAMGPGKATVRMAHVGVSSLPASGGEATTLVDLKDVAGSVVVEADQSTLGMTTQVKGAGRLGPIDFESVGYEEKIQRLDIEALRSFQRLFVEGYRAEGLSKAFEAWEEKGAEVLMANAQRIVAALPSYSMKLHATFQGQTGEIAYGADVQSAPAADEVSTAGWVPTLLKVSSLHADARLPKAWIKPVLQAKSGGAEVQPEEVEGVLGMALGTGYARMDGEHLVSSFKMQGGQMTLNGKPMAVPAGLMQ